MHMPNYQSTKLAYMATFLRQTEKNLGNEANFNTAVQRIMDYHRLELDVLGLVEQMEVHRRTGGLDNLHLDITYRKKVNYPKPFRAKADSTYHIHTSSAMLTNDKREVIEKKNIGEVYNGYPIQVQGAQTLYLVVNGTRHPFPEFETFKAMGFDLDEVRSPDCVCVCVFVCVLPSVRYLTRTNPPPLSSCIHRC